MVQNFLAFIPVLLVFTVKYPLLPPRIYYATIAMNKKPLRRQIRGFSLPFLPSDSFEFLL